MKKLPDEAKVSPLLLSSFFFSFYERVAREESALERDYERIHCTNRSKLLDYTVRARAFLRETLSRPVPSFFLSRTTKLIFA